MSLALTLKKRRDAERRLEQTSPQPVFNGGAADSVEGGGGESLTSLNDYALKTHNHDTVYAKLTDIKAYELLTNGDATSPEIVFYNGDVVMVEVT